MKLVEIAKIPLTYTSPPADTDLFDFCNRLYEFCIELDGAGLAAGQVGVPWNVFAVNIPDYGGVYIDCDYRPLTSGFMPSLEGCLSLKDQLYLVVRHTDIVVEGYKMSKNGFEPFQQEFTRLTPTPLVTFQHEIDHQHGLLISDHGNDVTFLRYQNG